MRASTRSLLVGALLVGAAAVASGCVLGASSSDNHGSTRARYTGAVILKFTNASPQRMCGFYMSDDDEPAYGDNWLPDAGVPSGGSVDFRVKPGKYKARWDTCRDGSNPYFAATMWRESALTVQQRPTQLYAYVSDNVPPTRRAMPMGRDYVVVRFPGQEIDPKQQHPERVDTRPRIVRMQEEAMRREAERAQASAGPPIAGFVGRVTLNAEMVAKLAAAEPKPPAPVTATPAQPQPKPPAPTATPVQPQPKPPAPTATPQPKPVAPVQPQPKPPAPTTATPAQPQPKPPAAPTTTPVQPQPKPVAPVQPQPKPPAPTATPVQPQPKPPAPTATPVQPQPPAPTAQPQPQPPAPTATPVQPQPKPTAPPAQPQPKPPAPTAPPTQPQPKPPTP